MAYPYQLKVKTKTLAEEAKIIRLEKQRAKTTARKHEAAINTGVLSMARQAERRARAFRFREQMSSLEHHHKNVVRKEARSTHLAYCFLRGRASYQSIEEKCYETPCWYDVARMVDRYSDDDPRIVSQRLNEWIHANE